MENNKKHIAAIFEEQKVFITFNGDCYSYERNDAGFRCCRMNKLAQKMFWANYRKTQISPCEQEIVWRPVAKRDGCDMPQTEMPEKSIEEKIRCGNLLKQYRNRISFDF